MRMTEILAGRSYAAVGKEFQIAKVSVLRKRVSRLDKETSPDRPIQALVEEGQIYQGWNQSEGKLDMHYADPGSLVSLTARDILRPWEEEMKHRAQVMKQRFEIRSLMSEMDQMLNEMDLPEAQVRLVQIRPNEPMAVVLLGIEEVRKLYERVSNAPSVG